MPSPMKTADDREKRLFLEALQRPRGPEREAYLDGACAGNEGLRKRLAALLMAHESPDPFLEPPVSDLLGQAIARPAPEFTVEEAGARIGSYKLLEKIGEGGCGVVYMAEQEEPIRRRVALKVIKLGMDTKQVIARFETERQALALMDHPNIAKVLDAGATDTGRPYFVMELVRGIKITEFCDQNNLSTEERLNLFVQICHAIQHAHQKGILHRDIKPSNILVTLYDGVPVPKVIDFGIAKATGQRLTDKTLFTAFQQFIGTPAYMSPEQAEMSGLDIDTRSDIYALGVLLYELLTGQTPFEQKVLVAAGLDEMRRIIREQEPVRPSTRLSTLADPERTTVAKRHGADPPQLIQLLRGDLDWIVMKALEKDRTRRYETANGVADDVLRHLHNEPVAARPPNRLYRFQKLVRRNKLVFAAAGVIAVVLVLGVVVSVWQAMRATKAHRDEAAARGRADEAARVADSQRERAEKEAQKAKESELAARQNLYAADMNLAYQAWQQNNLGLALGLLNAHRPTAHEPDLRGWEWRYLWGLCQSDALYTFGQHSNSVGQGVFGLAISPDNRLLATAGLYGEVIMWDLHSRRLIETPGPSEAGASVAFSPDGKLLAFGAAKTWVKLWDVQERREIGQFPAGNEGRWGFGMPALEFSPGGKQLAIGANGRQVVLWDLATHTVGLTLTGHVFSIRSLVFSPDGQTLVTGSRDCTVRVWSLTNGQETARFTNHTHCVQCVAISPDGNTVASGSFDRTIRIWDLAQHRQVAVLTNHTGWVFGLAFSPDGKTLASSSGDYTIKFWDTGNWREVSTLKGSQDEVNGIIFSNDGKTLFSGTKDSKILAWDGQPRPPKVHVLRRPDDAQRFWQSSSTLIPVCEHTNQAFNLWNPLTLQQLPEHPWPEFALGTNLVGLTFSPGGERAAFATRQGPLYLWDVERERQIALLPGWPTDWSVVRFSPDGTLLAAVAAGKGIKVWNLETLAEVATLPKSEAFPIHDLVYNTLCFATHNEAIAVGNFDGTVDVWDLLRKQRVANWKAHQSVITGVAFLPDGKRLVTVAADSAGRLWEVETQRQVWSFSRALNAFHSVAVSPDGQRIAAGTGDALIKIWNPTTGQEVATLKGIHDWLDPNFPSRLDSVVSLAFLPPDGNTLISGTAHEVRLWRAASWDEIAAAEKRTEGKTR